MGDRPAIELSMSEVRLLVELVERERSELPVEIHHTFVREYRDELKQRKATVEALLSTLRGLLRAEAEREAFEKAPPAP